MNGFITSSTPSLSLVSVNINSLGVIYVFSVTTLTKMRNLRNYIKLSRSPICS